MLHAVKRLLYNKQCFTESGVCQVENFVTHENRQKLMFCEYKLLYLKNCELIIVSLMCSGLQVV